MGFAGNAGSSCRSRHLPKNICNNNKSGLRPIKKKNSDDVSPRPKVIDSDVIEQIDCIDRLCGEADCTWLSSDSATPSLLSSDDSQDIWDLDCLELTLHDRLSSMLSLSNTFTAPLDEDIDTSLSDSSTTIPPNQASLFLNKLCEDADENLMQENVTQPQEIIGYGVKYSSVNCLESGSYSSFGWPHFVNSPVHSNPCTPLSDSTGTSSEFDRSDIWVSSLDLGREDFSLLHEKEPVIGAFGSHMPNTPTSREDHQIGSSVSSYVISTDEEENVKVPVEDYDSGEPLFWPFDYSSYTCLDFEKFLCLSPPKERKFVDIPEFHVSESFRKTFQATRKNIQEPKRIMTLSLKSKSATCGGERIGLHHTAQETATTLAGLSQSRNDTHSQYISKTRPTKLNVNVPRYHSSSSDLLVQSLEGFELYNCVVEGVSIEKIVGLTEFVGQEGINANIEGELHLCGYPFDEFDVI